MATEPSVERYRRGYAILLRLYSKSFRDRFGDSMEQTFTDRLREHETGRGLLGSALRMCVDTLAAACRQRLAHSPALVRISCITALLLSLPFLAMQFSDEVVWDRADFLVAGLLLFGAGLTYEIVARRGRNAQYRIGLALAVIAGLFLAWMNLAVGIIGNEENPANLMYVGVLLVGVVGAGAAGFRPDGMARALFATAGAQMLVGVIALVAGMGFTLILNGFFAVLWVASGLLFRNAARTRST